MIEKSIPAPRLKVKPVRIPKTYMIDKKIVDEIQAFALENDYSLAVVVDSALREFLDARA